MGLVLILRRSPDDDVQRECRDCGDEIPDPYDWVGEKKMRCSTCHFARKEAYKQERKADESRRGDWTEAKCECGLRLADCQVATCHREGPPPKKKGGGRSPRQQSFDLWLLQSVLETDPTQLVLAPLIEVAILLQLIIEGLVVGQASPASAGLAVARREDGHVDHSTLDRFIAVRILFARLGFCRNTHVTVLLLRRQVANFMFTLYHTLLCESNIPN